MSYPKELKYTKEHEWIKISGAEATIGITKFAMEQLGDVVHLDLPKVGATVSANASFGTIESTKTVSDLFSPVAGTVSEINQAMVDAPEMISEDPHGKCWLIKIKVANTDGAALMTSDEYEKYIG